MADHNETGKEGEAEAAEYLKKRDFNILHRNWRWHHYELDIVAEKDGELVIVEVKTRAFDYLIAPEDAVNRKKIKRIVVAADAYIRFFNIALPTRFDIINVIKGKEKTTIDHIEDAFYAPVN
jgi:Predicted endonuclease distantly related to archaeal Holliday junction resolvase